MLKPQPGCLLVNDTLHCIRHNGTSRQADLPNSEKSALLLACIVISRLRNPCTEKRGLPMPRSPLLHLPQQGVCKRTSTGRATDARKNSGDFARSRAGCKPSCDTVNFASNQLVLSQQGQQHAISSSDKHSVVCRRSCFRWTVS